jgi:hypothetical protein
VLDLAAAQAELAAMVSMEQTYQQLLPVVTALVAVAVAAREEDFQLL